MADKIYSYADKSWPVVKGCATDLPCAARCWAARECHRLADNPNAKIAEFHQGLTSRGHWTGTVRLNEAHLTDPLRWRKPAVIATGYHGDLFLAPDDVIAKVFAMMAVCHWHKFLILTKRAKVMLSWMPKQLSMAASILEDHAETYLGEYGALVNWPLPNVWLGVSVTNQADADERIPLLLQTPAAHRWVSIEPCVGAVDLKRYLYRLGWCVLGGESGPNARPMHPDWARRVRDDCKAAGVPYFHKQNGEWMPTAEVGFGGREHLPTHTFSYGDGTGTEMIRVGKKAAGNLLDGCLHNEMPEGLRV